MIQQFVPIDLPGKMLYKKQFSASVRKITPIEQKFILSLSQKQQKTNQDYIDFIKKLVTFDNPEMTFEELFWFDVQYILYFIRFTTYEKHPIKLNFVCLDKECDNTIQVTLNMGDLQIATPDDIEDLQYTVDLTHLGKTEIRNKIIKDDISIDNLIKLKNIDPTDTQMRLLLLDLCLISGDKTLLEMYELAEQGVVTAEDIIAIEDWFTKSIWGVKEEILVKCPNCGKESSRAYILALEDFFSAV